MSPRKTNVAAELPVIATVIEAGPLERQVCLLVESLRLWGGRLAEAKVIAIKPRFGPSISRATRTDLDRLEVEFSHVDRSDAFLWFTWANKTAAVQKVAFDHPGNVVWLDADILIVGEPSELLLSSDDPGSSQFAACAFDKNIGTSRDDDDFAPYFRAACRTLGVDYSSLPYIPTERERIAVRAYWNAGVYAFASHTGLADLHHRFTLVLLEEGIGSRHSGLISTDQVALGLAAHQLKLRHRHLPESHNFGVQPDDADSRLREGGAGVRILHYHGCLWPPSFRKLCNGLEVYHPDVAAWLRDKGPLDMTPVSLYVRAFRKVLEIDRKRRSGLAVRRARLY